MNYTLPKIDSLSEATVQKLYDAAQAVQKNSHSPYSHFAVGAALLLSDGSIVAGANVENISFPVGVCAEQGAVVAAVSSKGAIKIDAVLILGIKDSALAPCGLCRQMLSEFMHAQSPVIMCGQKECKVRTLEALLPLAFDAI